MKTTLILNRYDLALALCAQANALLNRRKAGRPAAGPTNSTTKTPPAPSLLATYAGLNGAAKFSFFQAHAAELFAQFKKGVK